MITFFEGVLLGLGYVMPIGAQNLFVVQSAVNNSLQDAIKTSSVVIVMDITLAISCYFGAGYLFSSHLMVAKVVQFLGGLYLLKLAVDLFRANTVLIQKDLIALQPNRSMIRSAFVLTWLNPQALIDGSVLLGSIRTNQTGVNSLLFILGVCIASITWFYAITFSINTFKSKLNATGMKTINIACGSVLCWFGLKLITQSFPQ